MESAAHYLTWPHCSALSRNAPNCDRKLLFIMILMLCRIETLVIQGIAEAAIIKKYVEIPKSFKQISPFCNGGELMSWRFMNSTQSRTFRSGYSGLTAPNTIGSFSQAAANL